MRAPASDQEEGRGVEQVPGATWMVHPLGGGLGVNVAVKSFPRGSLGGTLIPYDTGVRVSVRCDSRYMSA